MKISIILPTNNPRLLTVARLEKLGLPEELEYEIIIPDNNLYEIKSADDERIAIPSIINAAKQAQNNGSSGILVYCFGEPGVNEMKSIIKNIPVLGIASSSMYTASQLSKYWTVIATVDTHCPLIQLLVDKFGLSSQFKATKAINISPDALLTEEDKFYKSSLALIKETLNDDPNTNAFILGCGSMSQYADNLRDIIKKEISSKVTIIDPLSISIFNLYGILKSKIF